MLRPAAVTITFLWSPDPTNIFLPPPVDIWKLFEAED